MLEGLCRIEISLHPKGIGSLLAQQLGDFFEAAGDSQIDPIRFFRILGIYRRAIVIALPFNWCATVWESVH